LIDMRLFALGLIGLLVVSAGCPATDGYGPGGPCEVDDHCATGYVCARDGTCYDPAAVRAVKVTWTINGMPASMTTCTSGDLEIEFYGSGPGEELGYAPVPCHVGQFSIDKLPRSYDQVGLGRRRGGGPSFQAIDANGEAMFDLRF
jgi:hypothetical protein